METIECPECGAVGREKVDDDWNWSPPECPNGHGEMTEEGLLRKTIINLDGSKTYTEVGKRGVVICQSRSENRSEWISSLLETILRLEPQQSDAGVIDFSEASARKWNRKRAKRRFGRWFRGTNNDLPPITDVRLRELAYGLIGEARDQAESESCWTTEDVSRWGGDGFLQQLKDYEIRREGEPVLLVHPEIPDDITGAFQQARECYRWGQDAASFGLCRIVLDTVIRVIDERRRDASWRQPIREEFKPLLNCIPPDLLSDSEKEWVSRFWTRSSDFLHGRGPLPGIEDAWDSLQATATILDRLVRRGAFRPK
jgi:hypothetical protein